MSGQREGFVQASFFTKEKRNAVQDTPFSLPLSANRDELSQLILQLLKEEENGEQTHSLKEFDFLINGTLLHKTLNDAITDLTLENVVQIEYMERNPPPSLDKEFPHNDWVSAVQCNEKYILSGCYDYDLRLWDHDGNLLLNFSGHEKEITDVAWVPHLSHDSILTFLSSSHDQHIHIWKLDIETFEVSLGYVCKGHSRSVGALAVGPMETNKFISGGWDKYLKIWSLEDQATDEEEAETQSKCPRSLRVEAKPKSKVPVATLSGHTHPVTCLSWPNDTEFYSAGYDHCIRIWDGPTCVNKNTLNGSKVFLDIDSKCNTNLIASGHTDKHIRIWDTRVDGSSLITCTLSSHRGWVKRVKWSPSSDHQLVSGCYDNTAKLWDVRSPKSPLYTIAAHGDKVLCLDWSIPQVIATGGADNALRTYKVF